MRVAILLMLAIGTARAGRVVVQRGETLEHVARHFGCTTAAVLAANHLDTTLVAAGTIVEVPACTKSSDDDKAHAALAVIDGASWVATREPTTTTNASESIGEPWAGTLRGGEQLPRGDGYIVRRPARAFGAKHVVETLRRAIAEVRALYPDVHTLAIGDLSAEHGGKIADHRSHQSGLDVDVGFYFTRGPVGFAAADATLDLEATWALLAAFARTADLDDGVAMIFLDTAVQRRLYDWAKARGTPDDELAFLFQYPRGKDELVGLVRHWPNHADHFHVRFKPGR
jgi:murein endopeptidase